MAPRHSPELPVGAESALKSAAAEDEQEQPDLADNAGLGGGLDLELAEIGLRLLDGRSFEPELEGARRIRRILRI